jgi:hypothetical protein
LFYPDIPQDLTRQIHDFLDTVPPSAAPVPKAIIVPHAGYIYSGPVAAAAYARLAAARHRITRVVLIGPSHRVPFQGIAVSSAEAFDTPLGRIPVDLPAVARVLKIPGTVTLDAAHANEHSLEVHLPFLQTVLDSFSVVPLVAGDLPYDQVAAVLDAVWGGPETLIVVSSDLSHYLDYDAARALDRRTCAAIESLDAAAIAADQACGRIPVGGLLTLARRHHLTVETIDLRNSGDTAGPRNQVVGYGAWVFESGEAAHDDAVEDGEPAIAAELRRHSGILLRLARTSIHDRLVSGHPTPIPTDLPEILRTDGASFVTLKKHGQLRGCIGSVQARRPLAIDVAENAVQAAFHDPRFPPLQSDEWDTLELSISVLTPAVAMSITGEEDLLAQLRPRIDGLILSAGRYRAVFLPSVWETLPAPRDFVEQLKRKAGLSPHAWPRDMTAERFTAVELEEG